MAAPYASQGVPQRQVGLRFRRQKTTTEPPRAQVIAVQARERGRVVSRPQGSQLGGHGCCVSLPSDGPDAPIMIPVWIGEVLGPPPQPSLDDVITGLAFLDDRGVVQRTQIWMFGGVTLDADSGRVELLVLRPS